MTKKFDLDTNFVSVDSQEKGSEFELLNDKDEPCGIFITLAGPNSTRRKKTSARVSDFYLKSGIGQPKVEPKNRKARRAAHAQGEKYTGEMSDELRALLMADAVAATISWRFPEGFDAQKCTEENVIALYEKYPTIFEQVREAADDLDRFTKS